MGLMHERHFDHFDASLGRSLISGDVMDAFENTHAERRATERRATERRAASRRAASRRAGPLPRGAAPVNRHRSLQTMNWALGSSFNL